MLYKLSPITIEQLQKWLKLMFQLCIHRQFGKGIFIKSTFFEIDMTKQSSKVKFLLNWLID